MKYWSPDEPNTLRFPKPEDRPSFEVADDFITEAATVESKDGKDVVSQDLLKIQQLKADEQNKKLEQAQKLEERSRAFANIDNIKSIEEIKELLKYIVGLK